MLLNNKLIDEFSHFLIGVHTSDNIYQGWPDFFSHGPFSIIFNVLGAASSFQGVEGAKIFENFSADL